MNQEQVGIKTPEFVSLQFQLAGLGSRATAFIIDLLILLVVNILIIIALIIVFAGGRDLLDFTGTDSLLLGITIVGLFLINTGYFIALEYFSGGRTIGKRVIGIRAIQENGHSLTLLSSFIRNFLRVIDNLPAGYFLGIIMIFFHSKHKRIGDLVAGTIVVHERKGKRKKKLSPIEQEIAKKGLTKDDLTIEEWSLKSISQKDWNLIKTYSNRLMQLPTNERSELTLQMAWLLFPRFGLELVGKSNLDLENTLLVLYLILKEEWAYEL
ncbi:RDD family protein [Sporosarcina limicola]|uniref:RDD family membrane protein YckC n=1 Tax=Sporosarcina limicola TaxID=34101 RepID=A0A927MLC3_9BACL|nr:RDD family protein [Sporosarcina limicola]MBE1555247.1 putative RDD family membrane protein YckC [Sporosarcina limicola]